VVAVITLGVARKAEDGVELAPARGRLALDVSLRKPASMIQDITRNIWERGHNMLM
jgi:hypothetical protein